MNIGISDKKRLNKLHKRKKEEEKKKKKRKKNKSEINLSNL